MAIELSDIFHEHTELTTNDRAQASITREVRELAEYGTLNYRKNQLEADIAKDAWAKKPTQVPRKTEISIGSHRATMFGGKAPETTEKLAPKSDQTIKPSSK